MSSIPTLPGVESRMVVTPRLTQHILTTASGGEGSGLGVDDEVQAVMMIHGNCSSATFWEQAMIDLPDGFVGVAPDLRGYGETDPEPIDATRGLDDVAADLVALADALELDSFHVAGHSMGGNVAMKLAIMAPLRIRSMTLVATGSPYGYSGTMGLDGRPVFDDGAPAGGGGANPDFVKLIADGERGLDNPMSPRNVMRAFYWKPPFVPEREEELLSSLLSTRIGDDHYPGTSVPSDNWPGTAPGDRGVLNALAGKYYNAESLVTIHPKPPVLWIRGADDQIVGDIAMFDVAALGSVGAIPGHPGDDVCPPQPMVAQTRAVLDRYAAAGGAYEEVVFDDCGHTPYIEKPAECNAAFHSHLAG